MSDASFDDYNGYDDVDYDGGDTKGHSPPKASAKPSKPSSSSSPGPLNINFVDLFKNNLRNILPALLSAEQGIESFLAFISPYISELNRLYQQLIVILEPYGVAEIAKCVTGFMMMFFGGFFITTVAVYEAIVQGGLENFKLQLTLLYDEFRRFKRANAEDDKEDLDNDGVADVLQISTEKYTMRKFLLALRATDPETLSQSLHTLYTIFIAVAATLRLQFARTISLGASIGDQLQQPFNKFVAPQIYAVIEREYHKWVIPVSMYVSRFIGVMIAFQVQRILSTFHTAVKGARVFTAGLTELAERNGYGYLTAGYLDEALSAILAVMGIFLQLFMWREMPIVVKLAFFPAFLLEGILSLFVGFAMTATGGGATPGAPMPVA